MKATVPMLAVAASVLPTCSGFAVGAAAPMPVVIAPHAPGAINAPATAAAATLRLRTLVHMQEGSEEAPTGEAPAAEAATPTTAAPSSGPKSSPLAGLVGDQTLDEFQAKKERDNAKRLATRKITNLAIPGVTLAFLGVCTFFGEEKTKAFFAEFDNPMSNAPGFEQAKAAKAKRKAEAKADQEAFIKELRTKVRGDAAVKESETAANN